MRIIRDIEHTPASAQGTALALGNFDGVHIGHQAILRATLKESERLGAPTAAMTFEPHPRRLFAPHLPPLKIMPFNQKVRMIEQLGIAYLFVVRFTRRFSHVTAEEFVKHILVGQLKVKHVVVGKDFVFGHNRQGNTDYLQDMGKTLGFGVTCLNLLEEDEDKFSSTMVRNLLFSGDIAGASRVLGRPYEIVGRVSRGDARGRELGFPTANISLKSLFHPALGVYAARVQVFDNAQEYWHDAVVNIGNRPTFAGEDIRLEVHLLDHRADLYGKKLRVRLLQHLREERKFSGPEALKAQVAADIAQAKTILQKA